MSELSNMCIDLVLVDPPDVQNDERSDEYLNGEVEAVESEFSVEDWNTFRLRSKIEELRAENSQYKTKLFHLEQIVVPNCAQENQQLLNRIGEQDRELSISNGLYSDAMTELEMAKETLLSVNAQNAQLQTQLTPFQAQNELLEPACYSLNERFEALQVLFEMQSQQMEELLKESSETESELNVVKVECSKVSIEKFELCEKLIKSETFIKSLENENCEKEAKLFEKIGEIDSLKSEFRKLLLCNNEVLKRFFGESETEDVNDQDESNASTDTIEATGPEFHTNIMKASSSRVTRSASSTSTLRQCWRNKQSEKPFACTFANCGKSYSHLVSLRQHERSVHNVPLRKKSKNSPMTGTKNQK